MSQLFTRNSPKYGNKFTRNAWLNNKLHVDPNTAEIKPISVSRNARFRPLVSCFRKQKGAQKDTDPYLREATQRANINALGVGRVCTVAGLYKEQWGGKFVRLQRKEGFARRYDTALRCTALIHANTSDRVNCVCVVFRGHDVCAILNYSDTSVEIS